MDKLGHCEEIDNPETEAEIHGNFISGGTGITIYWRQNTFEK